MSDVLTQIENKRALADKEMKELLNKLNWNKIKTIEEHNKWLKLREYNNFASWAKQYFKNPALNMSKKLYRKIPSSKFFYMNTNVGTTVVDQNINNVIINQLIPKPLLERPGPTTNHQIDIMYTTQEKLALHNFLLNTMMPNKKQNAYDELLLQNLKKEKSVKRPLVANYKNSRQSHKKVNTGGNRSYIEILKGAIDFQMDTIKIYGPDDDVFIHSKSTKKTKKKHKKSKKRTK